MFTLTPAYLAAQGFAVLVVNYRGSTGFGQAPLHSLLGHVGFADVGDVLDATKHALAVYDGVLDGSRVGVLGGSHGGFLAAHCIGQHGDVFKAGVLINAVLNIPGMFGFSDIPDWSQAETGTMGRASGEMTRFEEVARMHVASPIAHVDKVVAPTLIILGLKDKRVPPLQSFEYYRELKARGIPTKVLTYPNDNHGIRTPLSMADEIVHTARWFKQYLPATGTPPTGAGAQKAQA